MSISAFGGASWHGFQFLFRVARRLEVKQHLVFVVDDNNFTNTLVLLGFCVLMQEIRAGRMENTLPRAMPLKAPCPTLLKVPTREQLIGKWGNEKLLYTDGARTSYFAQGSVFISLRGTTCRK